MINPKWSPLGAGLNSPIRDFMKSIATLRPASVTLPDLSRINPMSSPGPQLGSVEIEKQVKTDNFDHLSRFKESVLYSSLSTW